MLTVLGHAHPVLELIIMRAHENPDAAVFERIDSELFALLGAEEAEPPVFLIVLMFVNYLVRRFALVQLVRFQRCF